MTEFVQYRLSNSVALYPDAPFVYSAQTNHLNARNKGWNPSDDFVSDHLFEVFHSAVSCKHEV